MTNLNQITLDGLLERIQIIDDLMPSLTQRGLEKAQDELGAIEAELDSRMPGVEFRTLYDGIVHSFSCRELNIMGHTRCYSNKVGFEPIYPFDAEILPDDYVIQEYN